MHQWSWHKISQLRCQLVFKKNVVQVIYLSLARLIPIRFSSFRGLIALLNPACYTHLLLLSKWFTQGWPLVFRKHSSSVDECHHVRRLPHGTIQSYSSSFMPDVILPDFSHKAEISVIDGKVKRPRRPPVTPSGGVGHKNKIGDITSLRPGLSRVYLVFTSFGWY